MVKYHLGCGADVRQGYINVDGFNPLANVRADLIDLKMKPCDLIESHHVFEHFGFVDSLFLLIKWHLVLNIDGKLVLDVPDVQRIIAESANSVHKERAAMRLLYGSQEDRRWAYHINGWSPTLITDTLERLGMKKVICHRYGDADQSFPNVGFITEATKVRDIPRKELRERAEDMLREYVHWPSETALYDKYRNELRERILAYVKG